MGAFSKFSLLYNRSPYNLSARNSPIIFVQGCGTSTSNTHPVKQNFCKRHPQLEDFLLSSYSTTRLLYLFANSAIRFFCGPLMGSHRFLINPSYTFALLSDPGRTAHILPFDVFSTAPTHLTMKAPTVKQFRGSITRLQYLLFTLHECRYRHPCKNRFWLMASLCQEGVEPSGLQERFPILRHFFFPFLRLILSQ